MLKTIKIKNFKSIEDIEFEVSSFNVIVGHNGAGKTNFLKALKLISQLATGKKINEAFSDLDLFSNELFYNASNPKIYFCLELELAGRDIKYSFEITKDTNETGVISFRVSEETLENGRPKPILQRLGDKIEIEADDGTASSELVNSQLALSLFKKPQIIADVQNFLALIVVDNFPPDQLRVFGSIANIETSTNMNLVETLYKLAKTNQPNYSEIENELKNIIPELSNITVEPYQGKSITLRFKEKNLENNYSLFSASDGNLRTLAMLLAIIGNPKPSVLLIDEIENSMHPKRIKPLMALLEFFSEKESGGGQVIITTHSSLVLDFAKPDQINYIFKKDGKTYISKTQKNRQVLQKIEREVDEGVSLGELYAAGTLESIFLNPRVD